MISTSELVKRACPRVGKFGAVFYFAPENLARGKALGLGGFQFYVLGRGGVLGDVAPDVVGSAFGYFAPSLIEKIWVSASAICPPRVAGHEAMLGAADVGRHRLSDIGDLSAFCAAAQSVSAPVNSAGLALFAGVRAEPLPVDPPAAAMANLVVLREMRGSMFLAALVAQGVSPRVAHFRQHPNDYALFGWDENDPPVVSEDDIARIEQAEIVTDLLCANAYGVLDDDARRDLLEGLERIEGALGEL
jgi:hypothetical protein